MSSQSNGPYKSRLLNLLNRQYIYLSDRLQKTARQIKLAAQLGLQIVIYPIYLVVQTGRLIERQIEQKIEQVKLLTENSSSRVSEDKPIKKVLKTVEPWLSPADSPPETTEEVSVKIIISNSDDIRVEQEAPSKPEKIIVQGIACSLETRRLVLVGLNNEIWDILTQEQQHKLQQRLSWEIANYLQRDRIIKAKREFSLHLPKIKTDNPHLLLPVRFFWQVMEWMQVNSLATTLNFFDESSLIPTVVDFLPANIEPEDTITPLPSLPFLVNLDTAVAEIEVQSLNSITTISQNWQEKLQRKEDIDDIEEEKADSQGIQALIRAAIDYFFGQDNLQLRQNNPPCLPKGEYTEQEDPWLSWDDLYTDTSEVISQPPAKPSLLPGLFRKPRQLKSTEVLVKTTPPQIVEDIIEAEQDWLETEATPVGYVKHPLERILQWLDRILVWIEDQFVQVLNWLGRFFRK